MYSAIKELRKKFKHYTDEFIQVNNIQYKFDSREYIVKWGVLPVRQAILELILK